MAETAFTADISAIREHAQQRISDAQQDSSRATAVRQLLNELLAIELAGVLRYRTHYYSAIEMGNRVAASDFIERADDEQERANRLAARISRLGGTPDFSPAPLADRSRRDYEGAVTLELLQEDLAVEQAVVDTYRDVAQFIGDSDAESRDLVESLLAEEERYAEQLMHLIQHLES